MSRKGVVVHPVNTVYLYDGSLEGFYSAVFESVYAKELPVAIEPQHSAELTLFPTRWIDSCPDKARRVHHSVAEKMSKRAQRLVQNAFCSCLEQKELAMLRFLLLGYEEGKQVTQLYGHPDVNPLLKAERHLFNEVHLYKGFVRFSDYNGKLAAAITPKNVVLPFLTRHFVGRFYEEDFLIFDKTNHMALVYEAGKHQILPLENIEFPQADETERQYRALWKKFYNTVSIKARENHRCRQSHMPKRYWADMLEVQDLL